MNERRRTIVLALVATTTTLTVAFVVAVSAAVGLTVGTAAGLVTAATFVGALLVACVAMLRYAVGKDAANDDE